MVWSTLFLGFELGRHAESFDEFVHERVEAERAEQLGGERWSAILGDEAFIAACRARVKGDSRRVQPEIPEGRRLVALEPGDVISAACTLFEVPKDQLLRGKRGTRNVHRLLTMLVCHSMTPATTAELGRLFGIAAGTFSVLTHRARKLAADEPAVAEALSALKDKVAGGI